MRVSSFPFYHDLSDIGKRMLPENCEAAFFEKGQIVCESRNTSYGILYVEDGIMTVSLLSEEGREISLLRMHQGDVCLLVATDVLPGIRFDVTLEAETDLKLQILSEPCMKLFMKQSPAFAEYVHREVEKNFSDAVRFLQNVLFYTFDQRVATFLCEESRILNTDTLQITHEQIARHIGSAREVVSRSLKRFSQQGIVTLDRGIVRICDLRRLKQIIN